ncbi:DHA14-like major facilitator [Mycena kentingensis (nom. inval.)]|nr:DHA14-like major facilitator [Mycena kentingensis (nom. inval.)]
MSANATSPPSEGTGTLNGSTHSVNAAVVTSPVDEKVQDEEKEIVAEEEAAADFPRGIKLFLLMLALDLAVFLVALDNTIIGTAIPRITDEFHSLEDVAWYGSSYLLATAATQLLYGKLYTFLRVKWVFLSAIAIFEIGSAICGAAPNSNALIIGRAIAGLGSAGIFSGALIIIAHAVPLSKRPIYTGLIGAMYVRSRECWCVEKLGNTIKLTLLEPRHCLGVFSPIVSRGAGASNSSIAEHINVWVQNLPIGAVTLVIILFFFKMPASADHAPSQLTFWERFNQFDIPGTMVFIPAIVSLLLALQWGGTKYDWNSARIIALFVVFGVLIIAFVGIQIWKQENATVPPRIFTQRSIWSGSLFVLCLGGSFFIIVFYLPIWFQAVKGTSAYRSGISIIPSILSLVVASIIAGSLVTVTGYYTPWVILSSVLMSVGAGLLYMLKTDTPSSRWIGYQIVYGFGIGFGMQQPVIAAQTVLDLKDVPVGTSILMFLQTLGGALFIAAGTNIFTTKLVEGVTQNVPGISPLVVVTAGATSLKDLIDPALLPAVLEAYNAALMKSFQVAIALAAASIIGAAFMEWKSIKGKDISMGAAA